jgi:hypothetical protein
MFEGIIEASSGSCVLAVENADVFVCQYRDGADYAAALAGNITIGNLAWLYHLAVHDRWVHPMMRQTHYPQPRDGVPGLSGVIISLSGYSVAARMHLRQLVIAAGALFSRHLIRNDNSILLAAAPRGDKWEGARQWDIRVRNHLWLEDSYDQNALQSFKSGVYRPGTAQPVGKTPIDIDKERRYVGGVTHGRDKVQREAEEGAEEEDEGMPSGQKAQAGLV